MELVKLSELRKFLKVTHATMYRWQREGKLKFIKKGKQNYVTREQFDEFITKQGKDKVVIYIFKYLSSKNNTDELISTGLEYCHKKKYTVVTTVINILEILDVKNINLFFDYLPISKVIVCGDETHPHIKEFQTAISHKKIGIEFVSIN